MNWLLLSRNLGLLGMLVGGSMIFCLPWAFPVCGQTSEFEHDGFWAIVWSIAVSLGLGGTLYWLGRKEVSSILRKEALAIVGLGWLLVGLLGALPYLFSGTMRTAEEPMGIADSVFESVSGFTTTGASVLTELEDPERLPRCVLFWRCFTHWLGGMGIIVLFVAILGQLGAGGKALMRREVPGPISESVRPRVRETAVTMWVIYMVISLVLTIVLLLEGMDLYEALCHTYGTMATGGFSTRNASVGGFASPLIEMTLIVFMIMAGTNFSLYYLVMRQREDRRSASLGDRLRPLLRDPEFRLYLSILGVATVVLAINIRWNGIYTEFGTALRHAAFQVVAVMTTTGFGTEDFASWSAFARGMLLLLMFVGGCAGSTGGGIKVVRIMLFVKVLRLEVEQAYRPNVVRPLRIAGTTLDNSLRREVMLYFALITTICAVAWLLLLSIEPDTQWQYEENRVHEKLIDCASAVASTLNNIGPGLGVLGPHSNYSEFSDPAKFLLTVLMLLGRLELFAILVLLTPSFWRQ